MKTYKNDQEMVLDLLDFCGGSLPTLSQAKKFAKARDLSMTDAKLVQLCVVADMLLNQA